MDQIGKPIVTQFLNEILRKTSARNRNNYLTVLSAVFSVLTDNDLIQKNFITAIKKLPTKPQRNKSYSPALNDQIFEYLNIKDPYLLLFIKIVSYNFLRPVEVVRLRCGDIDLKDRKITVQSKTKANKIKVIPELLLSDLSNLDLSNPDYFLFTPDDQPGLIETNDRDKRSYWGRRFSKVKTHFSLDKDYTIYSFRHTYTLKLYRWLRERYHISETLDRLQLVTGHDSISGLQNYLRSIDAELPEDWSEGIK